MATPGRRLPDHERQRIIKLREHDLSIREIAKAQRVSPETVRKILQKS